VTPLLTSAIPEKSSAGEPNGFRARTVGVYTVLIAPNHVAWARAWALIALAMTSAVGDRAIAADVIERMPVKAPAAAVALYDWTGFYAGGHVGYGRGAERNTLFDPNPTASRASFGSLFGGLQAGYNFVFPSRLFVSVEADLTFANFYVDDRIAVRMSNTSVVTDEIDYIGTIRGRVGYAFDRWLVYGTGGFAWSQARVLEEPSVGRDQDKILSTRTGWVVGGGAELAIAPSWSARLEYLYDQFGNISATFPSGTRYESSFSLHTLRLGLNRKLGSTGNTAAVDKYAEAWPISSGDWNVHGQTTIIGQGYPSFRSPYQGQNSLQGSKQFKNTLSATAFLGLRLPEGTEFYLNPELMQGSGLSETFGLGGFSNGEAQKSGFPVPRANIARVFLRHSFGLGGEQETIEDGPNQLAGKQDISRITVVAGKVSVIDFFEGNTYAHDPRRDFLNWNMYCCGSYDLTMDKVGYTWGTYAELNQKHWAVRAGYFLLPTRSNVNSFDTNIPNRGQFIAELELRYSAWSQPGKLRLFGYLSRGNAGSYAEAVALPLNSPDYPDITLTRRVRNNPGFAVNIEQAITEELGLFARASWGSGQTEKLGWTDCDASFSLGGVLQGTAWGRPNDRFGLGGVIDALSPEARAYFAAGGLGILIGDGQLNYRHEKILESFYAYSINPWATLSFDYQFIANPAYNADRGPVSIFASRLHLEF
jgi:high affinity Mn2+ porin